MARIRDTICQKKKKSLVFSLVIKDSQISKSSLLLVYCSKKTKSFVFQTLNYRSAHIELFQQFVIDCYIKIEASRLDWVLKNQDELRVSDYHGLLDYVHNTYDFKDEQNIGKIVILASSFTVNY